jgi:catechol 2,3-dioxygenase-like lactoylglutathione lyase family enzyme
MVLAVPDVPDAPCVQLIEWEGSRQPTYSAYNNVGFFRACFCSEDVEGRFKAVVDHGGRTATGSPMPKVEGGPITRPTFLFFDPDEVSLQTLTLPGRDRLFHVNCNVSSLERSSAFYERVLKLDCYRFVDHSEPQLLAHEGKLRMVKAKFFRATPGASTAMTDVPFTLDVLEWKLPLPIGAPYADQRNLGIVRVGLAVKDFDVAVKDLHGEACEQRLDRGDATTRFHSLLVRDPDGAAIEIVDRPLGSLGWRDGPCRGSCWRADRIVSRRRHSP